MLFFIQLFTIPKISFCPFVFDLLFLRKYFDLLNVHDVYGIHFPPNSSKLVSKKKKLFTRKLSYLILHGAWFSYATNYNLRRAHYKLGKPQRQFLYAQFPEYHYTVNTMAIVSLNLFIKKFFWKLNKPHHKSIMFRILFIYLFLFLCVWQCVYH